MKMRPKVLADIRLRSHKIRPGTGPGLANRLLNRQNDFLGRLQGGRPKVDRQSRQVAMSLLRPPRLRVANDRPLAKPQRFLIEQRIVEKHSQDKPAVSVIFHQIFNIRRHWLNRFQMVAEARSGGRIKNALSGMYKAPESVNHLHYLPGEIKGIAGYRNRWFLMPGTPVGIGTGQVHRGETTFRKQARRRGNSGSSLIETIFSAENAPVQQRLLGRLLPWANRLQQATKLDGSAGSFLSNIATVKPPRQAAVNSTELVNRETNFSDLNLLTVPKPPEPVALNNINLSTRSPVSIDNKKPGAASITKPPETPFTRELPGQHAIADRHPQMPPLAEVNHLVEEVYQRFEKKLRLEAERRGIFL